MPVILEPPHNVSAVLGDKVTLPCRATGNPAPKIIWHERDTGKLSKKGRAHAILNNGDLQFTEVDGDQEGWYRCTAKNTAGTVHSSYVKLKVFGECNRDHRTELFASSVSEVTRSGG
jgi:hypothetical protein